jgi:hypothetical protein
MGKAQKILERMKKEKAKLNPEQIEHDRKITQQRTETDLANLKRELEYKESQLKKEIVETRVQIQLSSGEIVIQEGYLDGLKPRWLIENEKAIIEQKIKEKGEQLLNISKQNATKPSES